ncbi:MAG: HD domain-containing protein [Spirochaetaceae bacterium]|nr:MAG: HD domain-containing protein [Spirochaetaceae bacterium]
MSLLKNTISTADGSLFQQIDSYIETRLSERRLLHSRETAKLAQELCIKYTVDPGEGAIAGIAHDLAREYSGPELVDFVVKNNIDASEWEMEHPVVLHGKVAAHIVCEKWGVDQQICRAIEDHVLGRPGMPVLSRILFIADFCEPSRGFLEEQKRAELLSLPLEELLLRTTELIFDYLEKEQRDIAQVTRDMYQYFTREQ